MIEYTYSPEIAEADRDLGVIFLISPELTPEEIMYLEEPYVPHPLAGVMAQNKPAAAKEKHVWSTGDQKIGR